MIDWSKEVDRQARMGTRAFHKATRLRRAGLLWACAGLLAAVSLIVAWDHGRYAAMVVAFVAMTLARHRESRADKRQQTYWVAFKMCHARIRQLGVISRDASERISRRKAAPERVADRPN